jgi:hypothetical protein
MLQLYYPKCQQGRLPLAGFHFPDWLLFYDGKSFLDGLHGPHIFRRMLGTEMACFDRAILSIHNCLDKVIPTH